MSEPGVTPEPDGKTGRNEARKFQATWLNNVSVAFFLAGLLQPALTLVQQQRAIGLAEPIASAIFLLVSGGLYLRAQRLVRRLED